MRTLIEILPNIKACNIYLILPPDSGHCSEIILDKCYCIIKLKNEADKILRLPRGTSLVPGSVANLTQDDNHITARAQLDDKTSLLSSLTSDLLSEYGSDISTPSTPLHELLDVDEVFVQCKGCHEVMVPGISFQRVLPLPSVDWEHASEDWFCHLHGEDKQKLKPSSLLPSQNECFYSELYFLLHEGILENCVSLTHGDAGVLSCNKCQAPIGIHTSSVIKFWTHTTVWRKKNDEQIIFSKDVNSILLSLINNIDQDNFGVNCRLVLEVSNGDKKRFLYLVTMNTNQKLLMPANFCDFRSSAAMKKKGAMEDMHEDGANKRLCIGETSPEQDLKTVYVVKLLYLYKEGEDDLTGGWVDDINVHILPCSDSFLRAVMETLEASTSCLPPALRKVDQMNVGYIIKST